MNHFNAGDPVHMETGPDGPVAMTVYDDFVEFRTSGEATGFGFVEQGILRLQT